MSKKEEPFEESEDLSDLLSSGQLRKPPDANIDDYPDVLPIIPIVSRCYMPSMTLPLMVEPGEYYEVLKEISKMENKFIGLILTKDQDQDIYKVKLGDLYEVGVVARVLRILNVQGAGAQVILSVERRFKVVKPQPKMKTKHLVAKVKYHVEVVPKDKKDEIKAYTSSMIKTIRDLLALNPIFKDELQIVLSHYEFTQVWKLCDFAVALTTASREEMQKVLSTFDIVKRMELALVLLKKELDIGKLQAVINQKIESTITKNQREYFLREQLKTIQSELGIAKEDKVVDIEKFKSRAESLKLSEEAKKVFDDEIDKLSVLEVQSAEYSVVRGYLDWLTSLPWGVRDEENKNLKGAKRVLDADHYGLKDVKERIIEYISVGTLKGTGTKGYILCLIGPPGVGKTSVGKSIARSLKRKFYRFSLGGMRDEAEIKGHRRTYVGAMPGKILQALKQTKVNNPVVMLDEIDKLTNSYQGDPAAALLEVLDPEQNVDFLDHYLDVRFDLSGILFITTANTTDTIPSALLDRMEVIRLPGYVEEEKRQIAIKYLIPKNVGLVGLKPDDVEFTEPALSNIINGYCREAGVRYLEKNINKILRKIVVKRVKASESGKSKEKPTKVVVSDDSIKKYLGLPHFVSERIYSGKDSLRGISTGLAWTSLGGSILHIEAVQNKGKDRLRITGNTGEIMRESTDIALTYLLSEQNLFFPKGLDMEDAEIHIHIPEGATPKDGPSAGTAIATAMLSLLSGKDVPHDLAMTGEITLKGKVLAIGGLREKLLAAKREKITNLIVPAENRRDYDELPKYVKDGLHVNFVNDYKQIYKIVFGGATINKKKKVPCKRKR